MRKNIPSKKAVWSRYAVVFFMTTVSFCQPVIVKGQHSNSTLTQNSQTENCRTTVPETTNEGVALLNFWGILLGTLGANEEALKYFNQAKLCP